MIESVPGVTDKKDPDPMPHKAEKAYKTGAEVVPKGTNSVPMNTIVMAIIARMTLKWPTRSPIIPGTTRPIVEVPPIIASKRKPFSGVNPAPVAMVGSRAPIPKMTNSSINMLAVTRLNAGLRKAPRFKAEPLDTCWLLAGMSRWYGRKQSTAGSIRPAAKKPVILIDHLHPRFGKVERSMMGKMIEPMDEPARAMPIAKPRRRTKSFPTVDTATTIVMAAPKAPKIPRHNMNCQYSLHSAMSK